MPCYPALALLLGSAMAVGGSRIRWGTRALTVITGIAAIAAIAILVADRHVPTPGDITTALSKHPTAYKLSLGHMEDLTLSSFAYLRFPLALAAIAFLIGAAGTLRAGSRRAFLAVAVMMVLFFQAARLAMVPSTLFSPRGRSLEPSSTPRRAPSSSTASTTFTLRSPITLTAPSCC
jgi:hypothetical protein